MNNYIVASLLTFCTTLFLAIFVYFKNQKSLTNRIYSYYEICVALWSICYFKMITSSDIVAGLFWARMLHLGAIFIPMLFLHFSFVLLNITSQKRKLIIMGYIICFILILLNFTPLFVLNAAPKFKFRYFIVPGIFYHLFTAFFFICVAYTLFVLFKGFRELSSLKKNQVKYVFVAYLIGYSGGATSFLPLFNIPTPSWGLYTIPLCMIIIAYTIIRYHLLEIEVVIRKTIVFAGIFTFVSAVFISTTYLVQTFLADITGSKYFGMAVFVLFIILFQEPLKLWLIQTTDRFLLQKKYDYQKVLRDASEGMATVRELKWLLGLMTHIVSSKMRVSNIAIFLQEDELNTEHYFLKAKRGKEDVQPDALSKDNPICLWLKDNKKPLILEEVDYLLQRKEKSSANPQLRNILIRIKSQMQSLNAKVIIPAFFKGGLLGFLSLGHKLSGDMYTKDDLTLLSTLSSSAAIAIENARLFDSLLDEIEINNHLRKEEEDSYIQMMMSLAKTIDAKDSYTYDHVEMVYQYGVDLSEYLPGVNKDALKASLRLHDLGKIGVPDSILSKQGPLDAEEWKKIKEHTVLGARILSPLKKFEYVAKIILHHQEKFDGTGYPGGLKGNQIPLESRIISVVDAYHAMISDRPYRKALPKDTAIAELKKYSGTQFDPIVVEAFLKLLKEKHGITAS